MELLTISVEKLEAILGPKKWGKVEARIRRRGNVRELTDDEKDILYFTKRYMLWRRKQKHSGIKLVQPGHPHWRTAREIVQYITETYCTDSGLSYKVAVMDYLEIGWDIGCVQLKDYYFKGEKILESARAKAQLSADPNKELTKELMQLYFDMGFTRIGNIRFKLRTPSNQLYFIEVAKKLVEQQIPAPLFVEEFFEYWSWVGGWPKPSLLASAHTLDLIDGLATDRNTVKKDVKGIYVKVVKNGNSRDQ